MAAAERATRPSLGQQLRNLPGLFAFRFKKSVAFRVAAVSLGVHLIAMAVLFQFSVERRSKQLHPAEANVVLPDQQLRPSGSFIRSLQHRRVPHRLILRRVGVPGHEQAITRGIETILNSQMPDGSFGSVGETGYAALALLAEGDCSTTDTRRGRAIRAAMPGLIHAAVHGEAHGAALSALVEDWALSYDDLDDQERSDYANAILKLVRRLGNDEAAREGLAIAALADVPLPSTARGDLFDRDIDELMAKRATRLRATAVLARKKVSIDGDTLKSWLEPLFAEALKAVAAEKTAAIAVLTLQAPYRL